MDVKPEVQPTYVGLVSPIHVAPAPLAVAAPAPPAGNAELEKIKKELADTKASLSRTTKQYEIAREQDKFHQLTSGMDLAAQLAQMKLMVQLAEEKEHYDAIMRGRHLILL